MIVIGITVKNHLLSFAFVLVEGENNESWSWFLVLVRKEVSQPILGYRSTNIMNITGTLNSLYMTYTNVFDCITSA
jgi:hypothetical protein